MKYLVLFLVVISLPLFAQDKKSNDKTTIDVQTKEWMTKISSNSDMREMMMNMMLDKTNGDKAEMAKLGKTILDNTEMKSMISGMMQKKTNIESMTIQPLGMMKDSTKKMQMSGYRENPQK